MRRDVSLQIFIIQFSNPNFDRFLKFLFRSVFYTVLWIENRLPMRLASLSTNQNCLFALILKFDWCIERKFRCRKKTPFLNDLCDFPHGEKF